MAHTVWLLSKGGRQRYTTGVSRRLGLPLARCALYCAWSSVQCLCIAIAYIGTSSRESTCRSRLYHTKAASGAPTRYSWLRCAVHSQHSCYRRHRSQKSYKVMVSHALAEATKTLPCGFRCKNSLETFMRRNFLPLAARHADTATRRFSTWFSDCCPKSGARSLRSTSYSTECRNLHMNPNACRYAQEYYCDQSLTDSWLPGGTKASLV